MSWPGATSAIVDKTTTLFRENVETLRHAMHGELLYEVQTTEVLLLPLNSTCHICL
jgi:hypothetical protein